MRIRSLALFALTLGITACALQQTGTVPAPIRVGAQGTNRSVRAVEDQVEKARLATALEILSGKKANPYGSQIGERGSVEGRANTRSYITGALKDMGYTIERHSYRNNGENLFVRLMADTPTDEYILLGAHMDSVHNAGADDNGSGSTTVLEAARVMRELPGRKVNVMFAWFDEEELGLVGSDYMAADFKKQGLKITAVHTADMVGYDNDDDRAIEIERPDGGLWDWYVRANKSHGLNLPLKRTNSGSTDHVAFRAKGFPSVGLCEEWVGGDTTPFYHKRTDTFESIDVDYMVAVTKLMVAAVGDMAQKLTPPAASPRRPHSDFPGRDRRCFPEDGHQH